MAKKHVCTGFHVADEITYTVAVYRQTEGQFFFEWKCGKCAATGKANKNFANPEDAFKGGEET